MSSAFWTSVRRLFTLMDLNSDGKITRMEAHICFASCFKDVHGAKGDDDQEITTAEMTNRVKEQVEWLFAAAKVDESNQQSSSTSSSPSSSSSSSSSSSTSTSSSSPSITFDDFRSCYDRLLHSAYEEEVLLVDLHRAIKSLENNANYMNYFDIFSTLSSMTVKNEEKSTQMTNNLLSELSKGISPSSMGPKVSRESKKILEKSEKDKEKIPINLSEIIFQLIQIGYSGKTIMDIVKKVKGEVEGESSATGSDQSNNKLNAK